MGRHPDSARVSRRSRILLLVGVTFGSSSGMDRTSIATRKRRLAAPEQTACTSSAADAQEAPSFASSLQTILNEVQQLRKEQRRMQQEFSETLRQREMNFSGSGRLQMDSSNNISSSSSLACGFPIDIISHCTTLVVKN